MLVLYVLLALIILLLFYMNLEARLLKLEYVRFTDETNPLKIIQLSDIHINHLMVRPKVIKKIIDDINPDLILLTGDYISTKDHVPDFLELLSYLNCKNVFACLGNHEYKAFEKDSQGLEKFVEQMEALGVTVLQDSSKSFEKNSKKYSIIGFNDFNNRTEDIEKVTGTIGKDTSIKIAISHNPEIVHLLSDDSVDYLLTGHFHGGQIWAPFNIEFRLMRNEKLCKVGITRGLHNFNGIMLYISRGIGNICFPFRFFSRPEITVFLIP